MEIDFNGASKVAAGLSQKAHQLDTDSDQTTKPSRERTGPVYRSKEDYERAKDAAYDRFDAQWEARKNALKREKDYDDNQIDHSEGVTKERWKKRKEDVSRRLDQLDDQKDAAKQNLKRQWNDN
jgi:hypothetical protein